MIRPVSTIRAEASILTSAGIMMIDSRECNEERQDDIVCPVMKVPVRIASFIYCRAGLNHQDDGVDDDEDEDYRFCPSVCVNRACPEVRAKDGELGTHGCIRKAYTPLRNTLSAPNIPNVLPRNTFLSASRSTPGSLPASFVSVLSGSSCIEIPFIS